MNRGRRVNAAAEMRFRHRARQRAWQAPGRCYSITFGAEDNFRAQDIDKQQPALSMYAALAQPVEHVIRNDGVECSSHSSGTNIPLGQIKHF